MSTSVGPHEFERGKVAGECARCFLPRVDHPVKGWTEARPLEQAKMKAWPLYVAGTLVVVIAALVLAARGESHLVRTPDKPEKSQRDRLENRLRAQTENLYHARYVCRFGGGENRRWHCRAEKWIAREWRETKDALAPAPAWWVAKQIRVAEKIGRGGDAGGTDPWPNCPDPYDHRGASWLDALACENRAMVEIHGIHSPKAWLDGDATDQYRCGLQFDPMWEREYGKLCP